MARRSHQTQHNRVILEDKLTTLFVHRLLKHGKKFLAYRLFFSALELTHQRTQKNPLLILTQAVKRGSPTVAVKAKRKGAATYQIPIELNKKQGADLAIRWILNTARKRTGPDMAWQLSSEFIDAARNIGQTIRRKEETHRMAEANRAFSHYR